MWEREDKKKQTLARFIHIGEVHTFLYVCRATGTVKNQLLPNSLCSLAWICSHSGTSFLFPSPMQVLDTDNPTGFLSRKA